MPDANAVIKAMGGAPATNQNNPVVSRLKRELQEAADSKAKVLEKLKAGKEMVGRVGTVVFNELEAGAGAFLGGMAEGMWGEKLKLGGKVDARLLVAVPAVAGGLYLVADDSPAGSHVLAVGNGVGASLLTSLGREAGAAWKASRDKAPGAPGAAAPGAAAQPKLDGLREIAMTEGAGREPLPVERAENNRFRVAEAI